MLIRTKALTKKARNNLTYLTTCVRMLKDANKYDDAPEWIPDEIVAYESLIVKLKKKKKKKSKKTRKPKKRKLFDEKTYADIDRYKRQLTT